MVRAGVVQHPGEWVYGGYREIQNPKQRYTLILGFGNGVGLGMGSNLDC
jgi:hypothetical protein